MVAIVPQIYREVSHVTVTQPCVGGFLQATSYKVGQRLGRYLLLEQLGVGGMGVVYRAYDERLQRDVAVKTALGDEVSDPLPRKRLHTEALALSRLNHQNITSIYDFDGSSDGTDFLVMEFIRGQTLASKLKDGPLGNEDVLSIGEQVAAALQAAHEQYVIHCDLKPANVLLTPKGQVKVADFGLARILRHTSEMAATDTVWRIETAGTPRYMAPEQLRTQHIDPCTDIWGAGCLLYEIATGSPPFGQVTLFSLANAICYDDPVAPCMVRANITPQLETVILKCLQKEPDKRYQSASELADDLRRCAAYTSSRMTASASGAPLYYLSILSTSVLPYDHTCTRAS